MPKRSASQLFYSQPDAPITMVRTTKRAKFTRTPAYKASTVAASTKKRVELKRVADSTTITTLTSSGTIVPFPVPEGGDDYQQRDGRMVQHRAYEAIWTYIPPNLIDYEKVRVLVVLWKGLPALPLVSDVLDTSSWANYFGQYKIQTSENVQILQDKIYDVNTQGGLSAATTTFCRNTQSAHIKGTKRFNQSFATSNADLTEAAGSALYFVIIPLVGGGASSVVMSSTFVDI